MSRFGKRPTVPGRQPAGPRTSALFDAERHVTDRYVRRERASASSYNNACPPGARLRRFERRRRRSATRAHTPGPSAERSSAARRFRVEKSWAKRIFLRISSPQNALEKSIFYTRSRNCSSDIRSHISNSSSTRIPGG